MSHKVEIIYKEALGVGEGPHWLSEEKALLFVDIFGPAVFRYDPATGKVTKGVYNGSNTLTFIVPIAGTKDKFLIGTDLSVSLLTWDGSDTNELEVTQIDSVTEPDGNRFNDAKCDRSGRLWAGTMGAESKPGDIIENESSLYTLNEDKKLEVKVPRITLSNGLAWSTDDKTFYYVDSWTKRIDAFDFDIKTGNISNRRCVFDLPANGYKSVPDGMTIDVDGNLWLATFMGSSVLKIDPNAGKVLQTIDLPVPNVTSVTWGGDNLDVLYVTSAAKFCDFESFPLSGSLFKVTGLGTRGHPNVHSNFKI